MGTNKQLYFIVSLSVVRKSTKPLIPYDVKSSMPRDMENPLPLEADHLQGFSLQHAPVLLLETIHIKPKTFLKSADRNKTDWMYTWSYFRLLFNHKE